MISYIKQLARDAGQRCIDGRTKFTKTDLNFKSAKDLVTVTDKAVEDFLITSILARWPDHTVFGEETGQSPGNNAFRWIIDPIDGTTSFVHNQPFYAVSIGLEREGKMVLGVVYAPVMDLMFHAETGKGAYVNDRPIRVSDTRQLDQSVMATGFACLRAQKADNNLKHFTRIVPKLRDIRRYGSAALDLCFVAQGSLDGFWEMSLNLYDIAGGMVVLQEAGGIISDFHGGTQFPHQGVIAANPALHPQLRALLDQTPDSGL